MKSLVFSVYDGKAEAYGGLIICPTVSFAIRMFKQTAETEGHDFCKFAADFTLFQVGTWDDSNGFMDGSMANKSFGNALEIQALKEGN